MRVNNKQLALTVGIFAALMHALWGIAICIGRAQGMVNWALSMHFLSNPYTVQPFSIAGAAVLTVLAFLGGCIVGWVLAAIWNWAERFAR